MGNTGNEIITTKINKLVMRNLEGIEINLTDIFISLNIYESIFSKFKTGKILLKDTFDLIYTFPLVGGEEIEIYFTSRDDNENQKSKIQKFIIYKIDEDYNVKQNDNATKLLPLFFCSPELIQNEKKKISKRYYKETITLLKDVLINVLESSKQFLYDSPNNKIEFISNFWKPTKIINYLEENSINTFNDFIFFENKDGFNFKSISNLMNQKSTHDIIFNDSIKILYDYNITKGRTMEKFFNDVEALKNGVYGNTFYQIYRDQYGYSKFQNDFETMTDYATSLGKNVQHRSDLINNNNINCTHKSGDHLSKRSLIIKSLSKYQMIIIMNGDSTKTVGQVYNFDIQDNTKEVNEFNEMMTGKWFVTHINHELSNNGTYKQNIKIIKNAFKHKSNFTKITGRKNL